MSMLLLSDIENDDCFHKHAEYEIIAGEEIAGWGRIIIDYSQWMMIKYITNIWQMWRKNAMRIMDNSKYQSDMAKQFDIYSQILIIPWGIKIIIFFFKENQKIFW